MKQNIVREKQKKMYTEKIMSCDKRTTNIVFIARGNISKEKKNNKKKVSISIYRRKNKREIKKLM